MAATGSPQVSDRIFRFGPFELSEREGELRKNGIRIKLQEQPFQVLVELVANAGKVVPREELQNRLWPEDTFVDFDTGLNTAIRKLRLALNDDADEPRYIETLSKRGYRFVAGVRCEELLAETESVSDSGAGGRPNPSEPGPGHSSQTNGAPNDGRDAKSKWIPMWLAGAAVLAAVLIVGWWNRPPAVPVVLSMTQMTDDGIVKSGLQTDGSRIYFNEGRAPDLDIAQISVAGGAIAFLPTPVVSPEVAGVAPDGSSLLVLQRGAGQRVAPLWEIPLPAGEPRRIGNLEASMGSQRMNAASITPDGRILFARLADLYIADKAGAKPEKIISMQSGYVNEPQMSPDGRQIVFTRHPPDFDTELDIANADGSGVKTLAKSSEPGGFCCARWTSDGRYVVFVNRYRGRQDVWSLRVAHSWLEHGSQPHRLVAGPLSYPAAMPSRDGKSVFVIGAKRRGELVRFDLESKKFVPLLSGSSVFEPTFSSDGQWVAYAAYPQHTLWRSRSDGTDRLQLTYPPATAVAIFISPDGKKVAYQTTEQHGTYVVSMDGGEPRKVIDMASGSANWSPDGNFLVFSDDTKGMYTPETRTIDLRNGEISLIPGGKIGPQWAAPGKIIAARRDMQVLQIYDTATQQWSDVTRPEDGPVVNWAHSPDFQYFCYTTGGLDPRVWRIRMSDLNVEPLASIRGLYLAIGGAGHTQISVGPDNMPVFTREVGTQEIYSLDVKWP